MTAAEPAFRAAGRQGLIVLGVLSGFVGLVASLAPVGGAVIAAGRLRPDGERIAVRHQEGGVVRRRATD